MKNPSLFLLAALVALSACVTKKEYQEVLEAKQFYETEYQLTDSIRNEYDRLVEEKREVEKNERQSRLELERSLITNANLHRSYLNAVDQMMALKRERNEIDSVASYEKTSLEFQLSQQQQNWDQARRQVDAMEYELYQKGRHLNTIEYDYDAMQGDIQRKNIRINELERMLQLRETNMRGLKQRLEDILLRFSSDDLSLEERGGRFYVSLSSKLLFPSGSARIDPRGREALRQVADALKANPDIDILVEGHTDTDGSAANNWALSTNRAVAVTSLLTSFGVNPEKITAAGRGQFRPKAPNTTAEGKALNRRTEIILSPRLDELYEFLSKQ
jgi:chemotaxis protein MotB